MPLPRAKKSHDGDPFPHSRRSLHLNLREMTQGDDGASERTARFRTCRNWVRIGSVSFTLFHDVTEHSALPSPPSYR